MSVKGRIRFFNTSGPCNVADHYMLPPEGWIVEAGNGGVPPGTGCAVNNYQENNVQKRI